MTLACVEIGLGSVESANNNGRTVTMMRYASIAKLGAVAGFIVSLACSGAAQAVTINLGTIDTAGTISKTGYKVAANTKVTFEFLIDAPYNYTFMYTATIPGLELNGNPFKITETDTGGPGDAEVKVVYGPYPAKGTIDYSLSTAAPEPATWALMALGFAGLGFAGYRKSKKSDLSLAAA